MGLTCIYFHSVLVLGDTHLSLAHGIHPEGGGATRFHRPHLHLDSSVNASPTVTALRSNRDGNNKFNRALRNSLPSLADGARCERPVSRSFCFDTLSTVAIKTFGNLLLLPDCIRFLGRVSTFECGEGERAAHHLLWIPSRKKREKNKTLTNCFCFPFAC